LPVDGSAMLANAGAVATRASAAASFYNFMLIS
jgi:hypothetical protein